MNILKITELYHVCGELYVNSSSVKRFKVTLKKKIQKKIMSELGGISAARGSDDLSLLPFCRSGN